MGAYEGNFIGHPGKLWSGGSPMKCPCENCITFIMCKHRLYNEHNSQVTSLSNECPILDDWMQEDRNHYKRRSIIFTRYLFGLGIIEGWNNDYKIRSPVP